MIKVKIYIENDKGIKSKIELSETDNLSKLMIIQSVFELFGVSKDIMKFVENYDNISKAYSNFFETVETIEHEAIEKKEKLDSVDIKQKLSDGLQENLSELDNTYKTVDDYRVTGIKINDDGTKRYQLRYECPNCHNKGTHFVYEKSSYTWCHDCNEEMTVFPATSAYLQRDSFGNYFRAGDFKDWNSN